MKTVRMTAARGQAPPAGAQITIGVDLARNKWVYAVHWDGAVHRQLVTAGALEHLQALVRDYPPAHRVRVIYEACGFGYEIAWWAQAQDIAVVVVAPSRVERVPGPRVKTDRLDARTLAHKGAQGQLKGVVPPTRAHHEARQALRTYRQAVRARSRAQAQLRSLCQEHGRLGPAPAQGWRRYEQWLAAQAWAAPVAMSVAELQHLRAAAASSVQRLRRALQALAAQPAYRPVVDALTSHPGVGEFTALALQLEIGDPRPRFANAAAWVNALGLTPREASTGDGPAHRGAIQKCGSGWLRALLVQCAWVATRTDPTLRAVFDRLSPRVGPKRAIIAVARRLAIRLRARWLEALAATPPAAAA